MFWGLPHLDILKAISVMNDANVTLSAGGIAGSKSAAVISPTPLEEHSCVIFLPAAWSVWPRGGRVMET